MGDASKVYYQLLTLIETICPKIFSKSALKSAKSPHPVDERSSCLNSLIFTYWVVSYVGFDVTLNYSHFDMHVFFYKDT